MIIKISTSFPSGDFERLIPAELAGQGIAFVVNKPVERCDGWVVYDGLQAEDKTSVDPRAVYFLMGEAPMYRSYEANFLKQFARVLGYGNPSHKGFEAGNTAHNWFVGGVYDTIKEIAPQKTKLLSAVASSKTTIRGHRNRVELIRALGSELEFDIFGRGWREGVATIPNAKCRYLANVTMETSLDKRPALLDYKYSLAIENSDTPHYWTEKISDCILCGTLPFYWGCKNLEAYLPAGSFIRVDVRDPKRSLAIIREAIATDAYSRNRAALEEARQILLKRYALPLRVLEKVRAWAPENPQPSEVSLQPEPKPDYWQRKWLKIKHRLGV